MDLEIRVLPDPGPPRLSGGVGAGEDGERVVTQKDSLSEAKARAEALLAQLS